MPAFLTPAATNSHARPVVAIARQIARFACVGLIVYIAVLVVSAIGPLRERVYRLPGSDLAQIVVGARELLARRDPYAAVGPGLPFPWPSHLAYPATALVIAAPLARLGLLDADRVFVGLSFFLLAIALSRRGFTALIACFSWPALVTVHAVQWSALFTATAVFPSLAFLWAAKPTVALAYLAYRPSRRAVISAMVGGLLLTAIATVLRPDWIAAWLHALSLPSDKIVGDAGGMHRMYAAPIARPGGFLALAALSRWRRPEARLLVALACVPQSMFGYELLPIIALVPATLTQTVTLTGWSWVVSWRYQLYKLPSHTWQQQNLYLGSLSIWFVFLPATLLILTRPNEGEVPAWVERHLSALRGRLGPRRSATVAR